MKKYSVSTQGFTGSVVLLSERKTTMKTKIIELYTFDELDEDAKERARAWWREGMEFAWSDESRASIKAFCDTFGITPYNPLDYSIPITNDNFRGRRLRDFDRDAMPTGYCLDCDLWQTFYDEFKRTGSAKLGFEAGLEAGFKAWRDDMEAQLTDEYVDDTLRANEYTFTKDGTRED